MKKGTTEVPIHLLLVVIIGVIILIFFIAYAGKESGSGAIGVSAGQGVCSSILSGNLGKAICHLV